MSTETATLLADRTGARVLLALADGRALPVSVLATEAGLSTRAVHTQLERLQRGGLVDVEHSGRHRYYRLAADHAGTIPAALATIAPAQPVRSLRPGTRAGALRDARTCYDHLAGRLGVAITQALVDRGALDTVDGIATTRRRPGDALSAPVAAHPYRLGPNAAEVFADLGVGPDVLTGTRRHGRPLLRCCLDWSEQRHHLGGRLGAELLAALASAGWVTRGARRLVQLTDAGARHIEARLGVRCAPARRTSTR